MAPTPPLWPGWSARTVGSISGGGWRRTASSSARMRVVEGADVCLRPRHSQAPYLLGAASLAGLQLVWITPVAHSPGPLVKFVLGSWPSASCPVVICCWMGVPVPKPGRVRAGRTRPADSTPSRQIAARRRRHGRRAGSLAPDCFGHSADRSSWVPEPVCTRSGGSD
jgi:hypothetical protein